MKVTKLTEHIGAEVTDIDLSQPVDGATRNELYSALIENLALVVRDQDLTASELLDAGSAFGELMEQAPPERYWVDGNPLIRQVTNLVNGSVVTPTTEGRWHSDEPLHERPPKFTILYPAKLPGSGGGTALANSCVAYDRLAPETKSRIKDMKTVNVFVGSAARDPAPAMVEEQKRHSAAGVLHPLVRTNPDTGAQALYFHTKKTENIVGLSPEESQHLLEELIDTAITPELVYSHQWQSGDFLIWDGRSTLHRVINDYEGGQERTLYRLLVRGERPY